MLIGRSRRCDLTIRSPLVSRRHCRLEERDSGAFLRDLGSQNGTWIDGERIDHAFLQVGDRFVAGDVVLRLRPDGGVEEEGNANPRRLRSTPQLKDQGPALALMLFPVLGVIALLVLLSLGEGPDASSDGDRRSAENRGAPNPEASAGEPSAQNSIASAPTAGNAIDATRPQQGATPGMPSRDGSSRVGSTKGEAADGEPADGARDPAPNLASGEGATPSSNRAVPAIYSLEDLLSIAQSCDEELAAREADMAALLAADPAGNATALRPPSLEESWRGIARNAGAGGGQRPTFWSAPRAEIASGGTALAGAERVAGNSPQTSVAPSEEAELAGPLFPETARQDIALAIVEEGRGLIDRYHVRDVSYTPLRPLIARLRDLDGMPAAHGLLSLREYTHDHLGRVHRRVRKLEREARKSGEELDRGAGGAEAREDELTLRLAEMVKEHLETLVLIRDDLESALAHEGRPIFLGEVLTAAVALKEPRLFVLGAEAAKEHRCLPVVPHLIAGVKSGNVKIRKSARETLETLTGEKPGSSHRAWSEWWELREGKESVR